jgi:formylglycine-generating enzyme required for sulfatase activity
MKNIFLAALLIVVAISCQNHKVSDVKLNKTELALEVGDSETLIAIVLPTDADNKAVSWKSSNSDVAAVDSNGEVAAQAVGIAIITVTTAEGNKTANCTVTVTEKVAPFEEPEMVFVEGGTFMYGFTDEEWELVAFSEWDHGWLIYPAIPKTVKSFYMSKYLVTQKLWNEVMGMTIPEYQEKEHHLHVSLVGEGDNYPAHCVDMYSVYDFIVKLNLITGKNYRLATSVEWEYAARGGIFQNEYRYSGSNNIDEVAWYIGNSNASTHPVGEKQPNKLGIYDMCGNVWEWINSYMKKPEMDEVRGGCWDCDTINCFIPNNTLRLSYNASSYIGFRLVLSRLN